MPLNARITIIIKNMQINIRNFALSILSYLNITAFKSFRESIMLLCIILFLHLTFASSIVLNSYFYDISCTMKHMSIVLCYATFDVDTFY